MSKHTNVACGPKEPFGYRLTETGELEPIEEQIRALEQARFYIESGCSMQSTRDWVVAKTKRKISVPGLLKAIKYNDSSGKKTKSPATRSKENHQTAQGIEENP